MKKSSYLSERVYDAIPSEINMESLEYWKKILKEEGLQYVKKNHLEYFFGFINNCAFSSHEKSQPRNFVKLSLNKKAFRHEGEKMVFGANNDKGIVLDGFKLKAVTIGQDGYPMDDVLVHDATEPDNALHFKLAMMGCMGDTDMPVAMGVIRNVDAPTYDACVEQQVEEVKNKKKDHNLMELLMQGETWEVK